MLEVMTFLCPKLSSKIFWTPWFEPLDLNPWASCVSGCRSCSCCGRRGVQPCLPVPSWPALVAAVSAQGPLCHPCQGSACLPRSPGSLRETWHYSICFKNKQANKKLPVNICRSLETNSQRLFGVCWWSKWILDKLVLLVLLRFLNFTKEEMVVTYPWGMLETVRQLSHFKVARKWLWQWSGHSVSR